jgi:hypothetical protein
VSSNSLSTTQAAANSKSSGIGRDGIAAGSVFGGLVLIALLFLAFLYFKRCRELWYRHKERNSRRLTWPHDVLPMADKADPPAIIIPKPGSLDRNANRIRDNFNRNRSSTPMHQEQPAYPVTWSQRHTTSDIDVPISPLDFSYGNSVAGAASAELHPPDPDFQIQDRPADIQQKDGLESRYESYWPSYYLNDHDMVSSPATLPVEPPNIIAYSRRQPHSFPPILRKPLPAKMGDYGAHRDSCNTVRSYPETLQAVTGNDNRETSPYQSTTKAGSSPDISPVEPTDGQSSFAMASFSQHPAHRRRPQLKIRTLTPDIHVRTDSLP